MKSCFNQTKISDDRFVTLASLSEMTRLSTTEHKQHTNQK